MYKSYNTGADVKFSPGLVNRHLERILRSPQFDSCQRTRDFLSFVVGKTLHDRMDEISQEALAEEVFGRVNGFDATKDPIVRMHAGRVRRSLEHYYLTEGREDAVRIEIPKGTYVPIFKQHAKPESFTGNRETGEPEQASRLSILVKPLRNLTGLKEMEYVAEGFASELATELGRYKELDVFLAPVGDFRSENLSGVLFVLNGFIAKDGDDYKINLHLTKRVSQQQLWAKACRFSDIESFHGPLFHDLTQSTAAAIAEEQGILFRHAWTDFGHGQSRTSKALHAMLLFNYFETNQTPSMFVKSLAALKEAVNGDGESGVCRAYLARLKAIDWSLQLSHQPAPIEEALDDARRAITLDPADMRPRLILAYILLLSDQVSEALSEAEAALKMNDGSIFWLDSIGYILTLCEDWKRGAGLIKKAIRLNPYPRNVAFAGLWLDALHRNESDDLLRYSIRFVSGGNFWCPLMRLVAHEKMGDLDTARKEAEELLALKPDFKKRGRWLIGRYVKSKVLVDEIESSLATVGIVLD